MGPVASMISSAMLMQVQTFKRGKGIEAGVEGSLGRGQRLCLLKTGERLWVLGLPFGVCCSLGWSWTLTWGYGPFYPPAPRQAEELLTEGVRQRLLWSLADLLSSRSVTYLSMIPWPPLLLFWLPGSACCWRTWFAVLPSPRSSMLVSASLQKAGLSLSSGPKASALMDALWTPQLWNVCPTLLLWYGTWELNILH